MSLPQIKHTDTGLSDTATDRKRQFIIQNSPLEIHFRTFLTATNLQLVLQSSCIHTDTHGRKLQSDIQNRIINDDITVQLPVIIVRCTTVVWFAGCQHLTDLHDEYGTFFLYNLIFTILGRKTRIHIFKFLGSDKENILRKNLFDIIILNCHVFFSLLQCRINGADNIF